MAALPPTVTHLSWDLFMSSTTPSTGFTLGKPFLTKSGIIMTPIHPRPPTEDPVSCLKPWIQRPIDWWDGVNWDALGWGPNIALEGERFRVRVPVNCGEGLQPPELPSWSFLPYPIFFTDDNRGAPMAEVLRYGYQAQHFERSGGAMWTLRKVVDPWHAKKFLLRLRWPGTEREWMYEVSPDGTYGSIAQGVAKAYDKFLKCDAAKHDWGEYTNHPWYFGRIEISDLRLQALHWVGRKGPEDDPLEIYEADVHMVKNFK
ncbi:hypothetical protein L227DRAFT_612571 [Lentinus tigrinus ALCF2SS1-6]|uniref:Uncharacterized protein n=1 Tax=Lentinus tigrinus ALCF2SS1-6 TaxID=1328759 RepID=A0A5C2S566_9APHY|nr:hypothetical protein L227DRAFT_612571 [Lentinus tigrinus ALCF2SS1-6]